MRLQSHLQLPLLRSWIYCQQEFMAHPRDSFPVQQQTESKLKSLLMNFLYRMYLENKSDEEVIAAVRAKDLPRIDREDWWRLKHYFRQRELATPAQMENIKRKIGK